MDFPMMIWLFPLLFIFHDFEEIIFIQPWMSRNKRSLQKKFPALSGRLLGHFERITTASFALGVAEEFILISIVTAFSYRTGSYLIWNGLFLVFTLHLIMHCVQALILRRYVPAVATSVLCLPVSIIIAVRMTARLSVAACLISFVICFAAALVNLICMHKGMDRFNGWLSKYEKL